MARKQRDYRAEYRARVRRAKAAGYKSYTARREASEALAWRLVAMKRAGQIEVVPHPRSTAYRRMLDAVVNKVTGKAPDRITADRIMGTPEGARALTQWTEEGVRFVIQGYEWVDPETREARPMVEYRKTFMTKEEAIKMIRAVQGGANHVLVVVRVDELNWEIWLDYIGTSR